MVSLRFTALAALLIAAPTSSSSFAAPIDPREADLACEGDRLIDGHNHDAGAPDSNWVQDLYDDRARFTTNGRILSVRLTDLEPVGSDGALCRVKLKPEDGSGGLAHTIDVKASRPSNRWGRTLSNAAGAGWQVSVPVDSASSVRYAVFLGAAGREADPNITDRITVDVHAGAKGQPPRRLAVAVDGLDIRRMNHYRMAMNDAGELRIYVNDIEHPVFTVARAPVSSDGGNRAEFGLMTSRRAYSYFTNQRIDFDFIRVDTGAGRFESPGAVTQAEVPATDAGAVRLAADGVSTCTIVLAADATEIERLAADELADHLELITGARPDMDPAPRDGTSIFVGRSDEIDAMLSDVDFDALWADGIVIRTVGDDLVLSGGRPRGTLYAVYSFLQDVVGCRWWTRDEAELPDRPALVIDPVDIVYRPPFDLRHFRNGALNKRKHALRMRQNGSLVGFDTGDHTIGNLLPPAEYFVEHPEWFMHCPEGDDKSGRYSYDNGLSYVKDGRPKEWYEVAAAHRRLPWQPCLTANGVLDVVAENVLKELETDSSNWRLPPRVVWVSQIDGDWYCRGERCVKMRKRDDSDSGLWIRFVNEIAERIEKDYPNVLVATLAYAHTLTPPRQVKARDNVLVYYAALGRDHKTPVERLSGTAKHVRDWDRITKHLYIWDYETNFRNYLIPHPNHTVLADGMRFYRDNGVTGMMVQGSYGDAGEFQRMRAYVTAQIMWNPDLDDRALMEEILAGYYGAAAPYLKQWLELQHKAAHGREGFSLGAYAGSTEAWLSLEDLSRGTKIFDRAAEAVADDPVLSRRLRRVRLSLDLVWLNRYAELRETARRKKLPFLGPQDPAAALEEIAKDEFGVGQYRETADFSEFVEKLRAKIAEAGK